MNQTTSSQKISVIFDMDGVLVNSNALHSLAFNALAKRLGKPFPEELLLRTVGMHNNQILPLWLGNHLTSTEIEALALEKEEHYRSLARQTLQPVPGAPDLVRRLHDSGFSLAVGSSGPRANVELALERLQLRSYMTAVITGDDISHGKPNPEVFLKAAKGLGTNTNRCVVIEDASQGVEAALSAGMQVIAITTSLPRTALSRATKIIDSHSELSPASFHSLFE